MSNPKPDGMDASQIVERAAATSVRTFDQMAHESWDVTTRAAGLAAVLVILDALDTMTGDDAVAAIVGLKDALADLDDTTT